MYANWLNFQDLCPSMSDRISSTGVRGATYKPDNSLLRSGEGKARLSTLPVGG